MRNNSNKLSTDEVTQITKTLLENKVMFYFANKIIGKIDFIFHEKHIETAKILFPDLVEIDKTKKIGVINAYLIN